MPHRPDPTPHPPTDDYPAPTVGGGHGRSFFRYDLCEPFPYPKSEYIKRALWGVVQKTVFRWSPPRSYAWRRWLLTRFGARMAAHSKVRPGASIIHPWLLTMGEHATLADGVTIYNLGLVTIGAHTTLSQDVYVCAGTHDHTDPSLPLIRPPVTIGDGVWVCAGAFVGPNVRVGDNAIVGARAVAMKDVPARSIVSGNPAVVVRERTLADGPPED